LVALSLLILFCQADVIEEVMNGYFNGRSGSIVIDSEKYSQLAFQSSFGVEAVNKSTVDTQVFNIISRALNLPRMESEGGVAPKVEFNIFSTPKGNFFFSFDGLSFNLISDLKLKVIGHNPIYVTETSRPYSPDSSLATAITGHHPKNHGIINGREQIRQTSFLEVASLIHPNSLVISASYFHDSSLIFKTSRDGSYYWDNVNQGFKQSSDHIESISELCVGKIQFSEFFEQFSVPESFKKSWSTNILIAELLFVSNAAHYLKKQTTKSPNFLNFHFHSINLVGTEFGTRSSEFQSAITLIDTVLHHILSDNSYQYQLLFLPSLHNEETEGQIDLLGRSFPQLNLKHYPQIFLDRIRSGEEKRKICQRIRELIQSPTTSVHCMFTQAEVNSRREKRTTESLNYFANDDNNITVGVFFAPVQAFHLYFWFFLFLVGVTIYSIYMLLGIEVDQSLSATSAYVQKNPRK